MMRFVLCSLLSVTLAMGTILGQALPSLSIEGKTDYKPHSLIRLQAKGVDEKAGILWRIYPVEGVQKASSPRGVLEFTAPPGDYRVELLAITQDEDGAIRIAEAATSVTIASCHPPAPPVPPPGPNPPPAPPTPGTGILDPANAIGRISFPGAGCSATVIGPRRADGKWDILTAAHCNAGVGATGTITMPKTGKVHRIRVVSHNTTADICWMVTEASVDDIEYANLAKNAPPVGAGVWHQGYGVDRPRSLEKGSVTGGIDNNGQIRFSLNVSSGDSGGGIFRSDTNEVVATVCCTMGKGIQTSMWGGSCVRAWQLRPSSTGEPEQESTWEPTEIPTIEKVEGASYGVPLHQGPTNPN